MSRISPFKAFLEENTPDYKPYEEFYKHLHANPELSWGEVETSAAIATRLGGLSPALQITTGIAGTGLIAVLRNGPGRTVLLRADMDALPVKELTGLEYASKKMAEDSDGSLQPVMHACGHDMHVTALLAAAETLILGRTQWSGTLVCLFQPAEEAGEGARRMIEDGLYTKHGCPIPDVLLGQHVSFRKAGFTDTRPGLLMAGVDSMKITVYGRGGHASMPHLSVDPTVLASHIVVRLQTIDCIPGRAINVISDHALIELSIRSVDSENRDALINAIKRIVLAECSASDSPRDPTFELVSSIPAMHNDPATTDVINRSFSAHFGLQTHNHSCDVVPAAEDFSHLATAIGKPYCFWFFGGHDISDWEKRAEENRLDSVPGLHSPLFAPAIQPTLATGAEALVVAALTMLSGDKNGFEAQG
ncbi:hypothetical protein TrVFT333_002832 [Trichoderma virens FT-333]|nr:hypothetical protein TrVFT333_002832 [Trichoderma virens FT-333]